MYPEYMMESIRKVEQTRPKRLEIAKVHGKKVFPAMSKEEREEIFEECDIVMIFKPTFADFPFFREAQVIWGALHLVQTQPDFEPLQRRCFVMIGKVQSLEAVSCFIDESFTFDHFFFSVMASNVGAGDLRF